LRGFEKRNRKEMLIGGTKRTSKNVRNKEIIEMRWEIVMKCFKGYGCNFVMNTRSNRKPIKQTKSAVVKV